MFKKVTPLAIISIYVIIVTAVRCAIITPREMDIRRAHSMDIKKRPFCNAFTGCGKKRALDGIGPRSLENMQNMQEDVAEENTLSDLIDLNSEPAVEDLMRQIMSQAKLWEALQEASREIYSQKHHLDPQTRYPMSFSTQ